jgi:hypothetical protein
LNGLDSLPAYMINQVEGVNYLEEIGELFEKYFDKEG